MLSSLSEWWHFLFNILLWLKSLWRYRSWYFTLMWLPFHIVLSDFDHGPFLSRILHDDVIEWKHFLSYWSVVWVIYWSPVNFPHKGQWPGGFDVFFDQRLNKQLSKQSWGWWFEMPSGSLCRHYNAYIRHCPPPRSAGNKIQLNLNQEKIFFSDWTVIIDVYLFP